MFFTPYIGVKLLPNFAKNRGGHAGHDIYDTRLYRILRRAVGWAVRFRWVVIALTLAAFGAGVAAFAQVQQQFFPISSRPELFIEIRMPEGTSIGVTEAAAKKAEALIKDDPDLEYYTTYIGAGSPRFFLALNPVLPNESFALIVMMTKGAEARERLKARLEGLVAQNVIPEARLRIDRLNFGPPVGFPVQFRVIGSDVESVRAVADKVRTAMRANPNTRDVQFDWNEQKKSIRLEVDQDRARSLGLTSQDIAQTLGTLLSGYTVTEYKEGIELVPVVARAIPEERLGLGSFEDLTIPTALVLLLGSPFYRRGNYSRLVEHNGRAVRSATTARLRSKRRRASRLQNMAQSTRQSFGVPSQGVLIELSDKVVRMACHAARRDEKPRPGHCRTGNHCGQSDRHLAEPRENRRGAGSGRREPKA